MAISLQVSSVGKLGWLIRLNFRPLWTKTPQSLSDIVLLFTGQSFGVGPFMKWFRCYGNDGNIAMPCNLTIATDALIDGRHIVVFTVIQQMAGSRLEDRAAICQRSTDRELV